MIAIIDIGSNTVRLNVYKRTGSCFQLQFSEKEMAGLASHIENGILVPAGYNNLIRILKGFRQVLDNLGIQAIYPFATASLRLISNSAEVLNKIEKQTSFKLHLISGEEEGHLGFIGAKLNSSLDRGLMVDIGGGSTELVSFKDHEVKDSVSVGVGSLNLYKQHIKDILPTKQEQKEIRTTVHKKLDKTFKDRKVGEYKTILGVGGTIRALLKLENYIYDRYGNRIIKRERVLEIIKMISDGSPKAQGTILKVIPNRIHTILPGLLNLKEVMKYFDVQEIIVSETGAREGYLLKYVLK